MNNAAVLEELDSRFNEIAPHMLFYFHKIPPDQQYSLGNKIRENFFQNQSIISNKNFPKLVKVFYKQYWNGLICIYIFFFFSALFTVPYLLQLLGDRLITAYVEYAITEHARYNFGPIYYMKFNYRGQYSTIDSFNSNATISGK